MMEVLLLPAQAQGALAKPRSPHTPCAARQRGGRQSHHGRQLRLQCRALLGRGKPPAEPRVSVAPPGGAPPPPPGTAVLIGPHWFSVVLIVGATVTTLAGGFILFVLYLRPVLLAAERATAAAERAALEMEVAAQEMEKTAKMMQEDMPLTFQDMQRTSKEFEILGKQLNYLAGVVVKPVKEPVQWVGRAAETTASSVAGSVTSVTTGSIRRVVDDIKTLANSLNPTITQVRERLGLELSRAGNGMQQLKPPGAAAAGSSSSNGAPLSRASEVAMQAEAAARDVNVSRRQADAQAWIAAYRSRSRGNKKAAAAAAASHPAGAGMDTQQLEEMGQMLAGGMMSAEHEAATAAVFAALERAQRAAEEAASASGALEAAIAQAETRGALRSMDQSSSSDEDDDDYTL